MTDYATMTDAELRAAALPLMGWRPIHGDRWILGPSSITRPLSATPDPTTNVADAMALAEAMRAKGWWWRVESPAAWRDRHGGTVTAGRCGARWGGPSRPRPWRGPRVRRSRVP